MSRYGYDYSLTPSGTSGWRSVLTNVLTVGTIVAVSAISGAVVALELLGPPTSVASAPAITASNVPPAPARAARVVTPRMSQQVSAQANAGAAVEQPQTPAAAAQPAAAPAPQAAPAAPVASADDQAAAHVSESELTFTSGYARRRALQAAAASSANIEVARAEAQTQMGRAATTAKPKVVARLWSHLLAAALPVAPGAWAVAAESSEENAAQGILPPDRLVAPAPHPM